METVIKQYLMQAEKTPDNTAVLDIQGAITYDRMNKLSAAVAEHVLSRLKGSEKRGRIALLLPRTRAFVIAQFGVLRACCAVLPIDAEYPPERVRMILEDSGCLLCLTTVELAFKAEGFPTLLIEDIRPEGGKDPEADKTLDLSDPEAEGYILYTSGSTGKPKGVIHRQKMLNCCVENLRDVIYPTERSRSLNIASFSFIAGLMDILPMLTAGGSVYIANETERKNMEMIYGLYSKRHITGMFCPPRMYSVLKKLHGPLPLEYVLMVGEKFTGDEDGDSGVWEVYGSSEASLPVLIRRAGEGSPLSLGKPSCDTEVYLLDKEGNRIEKPGEIGELCISSPYLALGYEKLPEETAERFTKNPFRAGERLYHSGDLMEWDKDGSLIFHGRRDHMVKIRGYRVELGEIECTAAKYPGISQAATAVNNDALCLYYTTDDSVDEADLNTFLARSLPEYMMPKWYLRLQAMPLNPNGKLDRSALPEPDISEARTLPFEAPVNETELKLCTAFEKAIGLKANSVGRTDDFFAVGGDSIRAVEVMTITDLEGLNARMIFRHRTAAEIAEELAAVKLEDIAEYEEQARKMRLPITSGQALMIDDLFENIRSTMYNLSGLFKLGAALDAVRLAEAVDRAAAAHPGLGSVFDFDGDGYILQYIKPGILEPTPVMDITPEELNELKETLVKPFRIFRTPLFRSGVYRCNDGEETQLYLFLDMLHTVSDGSSLSVLYRDIARAYRGEALSPDHFYSYVRKEAEIRQTDAFEEARKYFSDILGDRNWCRIPTPDTDAWDTLCESAYAEDIMTTDQMEKAEKCLGYSRNVLAITAAMLSLKEYCGEDRISVDYINNNRMERHLKDTVGLLYKTLPIAVDLSSYPDTSSLLKEVNRQEIESFVYSVADYTAKVDLITEDAITINYISDLGSSGNFEGFDVTEIPLGDEEEEAMGGHADLYISEEDGSISLQIDYLKNAYKESSIRRFLDIFTKHLKELVENPS